ncbi:MAG: symmetrical bis(5'-nucleosyl)-tetraphosphatase [Gammaproteobacteria bacterium]|jgi:bis(5'-nucleosyl)-tetraphosphatase (symmetrical)
MATYAIGDIQGCYNELIALLDRINFDSAVDQLWLVGDLVNRGPDSLAVVEFVRGLGDAAIVVLGNHDLHLLACAYVGRYSPGKKDTFADVLRSPHADELTDWLRRRPLLHRDRTLGYTMVHAGLPRHWSLEEAEAYAAEVTAVLRGANAVTFFENMYGDEPDNWDPALAGWARLRLITNYLTRLRYTSADGRINFKFKGPLGTQPKNLAPWYEFYELSDAGESIVFGHWSALHLSQKQMRRKRIFALDTGAVWGGTLTAMRLEDQKFFEVPSSVALPIND